MSDQIQQQYTVGGQTVIIYNNRKPDVYSYEDIFDPTNPVSGKIFPSLRSVIIKSDGTLWYVSSRDESTFSVTLSPCGILTTEENEVKIISYGNDKFCLYMDDRTNPYKLVIDAELLFYGNNIVEYSLYKTNTAGEEEIISMYLDATGNFVSSRVPMLPLNEAYPVYKYPTNCHTTHQLVEGEPVVLRARNNLGNIVAEITLYVRNAAWYNDLQSHTNPIVKLDATCLQMRGDDFYIYEKQDPSHLNIRPYLRYADGSLVEINIDNVQCFLYGLEYFIPSYPGYSQTLVLKYFLNHRETATDATEVNNRRFLTCTKNLVVLQNLNTYSIKVSVIPIWVASSATWKLKFYAYSDARDAIYDITDLVEISEFYSFDGTSASWGKEQHVEFTYDLQSVFNTDDELKGAQAIWITCWDYSRYVKYTFRDGPSDNFIYGVDGSVTRRPIIHFDDTLKRYFIPTSIFKNWEAVVESFFRMARPPYDVRTETQAPEPTHFLIRDASTGQMVIGGPIPAANYGQSWPTIIGAGPFVGHNVIVEFLELVGENFHLLYGVPVDVVPGTYNSADVNLY